jgi:hypothetical protein
MEVELACTLLVFGLAIAVHAWQSRDIAKSHGWLLCWLADSLRSGKGRKASEKRFVGEDSRNGQDGRESAFARAYPDYGYGGRICELSHDFPAKDGEIYLDHAGATLCSKSQVQTVESKRYTQRHAQP